MMAWAKPEDAARMFRDDPSSIFWPLGFFVQRFGLTIEEVQSELEAGRLVATAPKGIMKRIRKNRRGVAADEFEITGQALIDWMINPQTPPLLLEKLKRSIGVKPS